MSRDEQRILSVAIDVAMVAKVRATIVELENQQDVVTVARAACMLGIVDANTAAEMICDWETQADGNLIIHEAIRGKQELSDDEVAMIQGEG